MQLVVDIKKPDGGITGKDHEKHAQKRVAFSRPDQ